MSPRLRTGPPEAAAAALTSAAAGSSGFWGRSAAVLQGLEVAADGGRPWVVSGGYCLRVHLSADRDET